MIYLICSYNKIQELNNLPKGLEKLSCEYNKIYALNNIPESLIKLDCNENPLPSFDINVLKEIDINNKKREILVLFIIGIQKNRFDKVDMLEKIGKYVLI